MVIVDTSIWVQFFRMPGSAEHEELNWLLEERQAALVGPVLAEVLQGARSTQEIEELQSFLFQLPYLEDGYEAWLRVGTISHQLRQRGQPVGIVDLLIAALALEHSCTVYTRDEHFQRIPGLELYEAGKIN